MGHVFISHSERDLTAVNEIVTILEHAGYRTWFFERDTLPGESYLIQIQESIERCQAVVLVASPNSITSDQVTKEVVAAFERRKPFFPLLLDMTPPQLKERQPEWRHALGGTAFICADSDSIPTCVSRIIVGLKSRGISPGMLNSGSGRPSISGAASTPIHLADRVLAARRDIEGERRQATVMFAEVADFTSTSQEMDPEATHGLVIDCLNLMTEEIRRYEGYVTQMQSHGVMAIFGAPKVVEDAPRRALHAALAMKRVLEVRSQELKTRGIEFSMKAGLDTGLVIICRIADDASMGYAALGDTVSVAQKMLNEARPWSIRVSESTRRLAEGFFEFHEAGKIELGGRIQPVLSYQVKGLSAAGTRIAVSRTRGLTPFVGRTPELEHLIAKFELAKSGNGQVVGIIGEPGIGKSRLLLQFRECLIGEDHRYLEGGCFHYGDSVPFLPLLRILRACFGTEEGEPDSSARAKITQRLQMFSPRLDSALSPLLDLLSLGVDDEQYRRLDPARKKQRIFEAARSLMLSKSHDAPLVLAIEDLHWIDRPSEELLSYLMPSVAHSKVLLILLYRPEYKNPWTSNGHYSQIRMLDLPPETSLDMIDSVFREGKATSELKDFIQSRALGNPLFIEEFVRSLFDKGSIHRDNGSYVLSASPSEIQIPETVQGIIDARISRLDERRRHTLQVASAIGRNFSLPVLQNVLAGVQDLSTQMADLQAGDFIYEIATPPEPEYVFKHALTHDVAYASLLHKKRQEIHSRIGRVLEEMFPDRLEEFCELLAHHHTRGGDHDRAIKYLKMASLKAGAQNSMLESLRYGREAIAMLDRMPPTTENKKKGIEMRLLLSGPLAATGWGGDSLKMLEEGANLAEEFGDLRSLAGLWGAMGMCITAGSGDIARARGFAEKAYRAATETGDPTLIAVSCFELCFVCSLGDTRTRIIEVVPSVLAMLEREKLESRTDIGKYFNYNLYSVLRSYYGLSLGYLGDFEKGVAECEKACDFADRIGNLYSLGLVEFLTSVNYLIKGDVARTIERLEKCTQTCEKGQLDVLLWVALTIHGLAHVTSGEYEIARGFLQKRADNYRRTRFPSLISMNYYGLGIADLESGNLESARDSFQEAVRLADRHGERAHGAISSVGLARVMAMIDSSQSVLAEEQALAGIRTLEELNLRPLQAQAYMHLGRLYAELRQKSKARESLMKAQMLFNEMGMDSYATKAGAALQHLTQDELA